MTQKENALELIRFGKPERIAEKIPGYWLHYLGADHQGYAGGGHDCPVGTVWTDIWGTGWHKEAEGVMGFPKENPLADPAALAQYQWPDPDDERICSPIYQQAAGITEEIRRENFIIGSHRDTLWEKSYMLVGMENMMEYLYTDPAYAREIFRRIMDFQLGIAQHYAACGVEMVYLSDDLGTQHSLLLSPAMIREFLLPEYRRLFQFYKERGVLIHFHSCGHIEPLLETFIELGVDILNPVQATANNLEHVIRVTEGKMCIDGAIPTALLMEGPPDKIRQTVRETIGLLGRKGGYFCCPDQSMPVPEENLAALSEAVRQYGGYAPSV